MIRSGWIIALKPETGFVAGCLPEAEVFVGVPSPVLGEPSDFRSGFVCIALKVEATNLSTGGSCGNSVNGGGDFVKWVIVDVNWFFW